MGVTYGFYDSVNGDRQYTVDQISAMFDGFFTDGIFRYYGDAFSVDPISGMSVSVGSGKAWFNHRYIANDLPITFTLDESGEKVEGLITDSNDENILDSDNNPLNGTISLQNRVDAIVIEINSDPEIRENSIKVIKGQYSTSFIKPTLVKNNYVSQYAIAYIYVKAGSTEILDEDIEYVVGSNETPYSKNVVLDQENLVNSIVSKFSNEYRLNAAYPIGSIYISTISSNPSSYLGGKWEAIKGRFLVASGTVTDGNNETVTFYSEGTGGEYGHRLSLDEMPSHTHSATVGTAGSHSHTYKDTYSNYIDVPYYINFDVSTTMLDHTAYAEGHRYPPEVLTKNSGSNEHTHDVVNLSEVGNFASHNNLPPYLAVYIWKRVA